MAYPENDILRYVVADIVVAVKVLRLKPLKLVVSPLLFENINEPDVLVTPVIVFSNRISLIPTAIGFVALNGSTLNLVNPFTLLDASEIQPSNLPNVSALGISLGPGVEVDISSAPPFLCLDACD